MTTTASVSRLPKRHPLSAIFGDMDEDAFATLVDSVRDHGVDDTEIIVYEDQILDGYHRVRAATVAGRDDCLERMRQDKTVFDPQVHGDPWSFVVRRNLERRHLTPSQRALLASDPKVRKIAQITDDNAAKVAGVSRRLVTSANYVQRHGTMEQIQAVREGRARVVATEQTIRESQKPLPEAPPPDPPEPAQPADPPAPAVAAVAAKADPQQQSSSAAVQEAFREARKTNRRPKKPAPKKQTPAAPDPPAATPAAQPPAPEGELEKLRRVNTELAKSNGELVAERNALQERVRALSADDTAKQITNLQEQVRAAEGATAEWQGKYEAERKRRLALQKKLKAVQG